MRTTLRVAVLLLFSLLVACEEKPPANLPAVSTIKFGSWYKGDLYKEPDVDKFTNVFKQKDLFAFEVKLNHRVGAKMIEIRIYQVEPEGEKLVGTKRFPILEKNYQFSVISPRITAASFFGNKTGKFRVEIAANDKPLVDGVVEVQPSPSKGGEAAAPPAVGKTAGTGEKAAAGVKKMAAPTAPVEEAAPPAAEGEKAAEKPAAEPGK